MFVKVVWVSFQRKVGAFTRSEVMLTSPSERDPDLALAVMDLKK